MSVPPGPEPGQSLEDWVRESLLGPLPADPEPPTAEPPPVVPAQRSAPPPVAPPPVLVPAQRSAPPTVPAVSERGPADEAVGTPARVAEPPLATIPDDRRRVALGAAVAAAAVLGIGLVTSTPAPSPGAVERPAAIVGATPAPAPALTVVAAPALPAAVVVPFAGGRVDVGGGWRIGVSRPYLCPVLMTIPALASGDSRMVRMTVTIVNDTGTPQPARAWTLQATADGGPVEMILRPSAGFRGVPERILAPGERTRFLVAVRLPAQRVAVEVTAAHPSGVRAALTGRV